MKRLVTLLGFFSLISAQTLSPQLALERLFTEPVQKEWFAKSFLQTVPFEQIDPILQDLIGQYGAYQEVKPDGQKFQVILEKASVPTSISLDDEGKIIGLFLEPPVPILTTLEEAIEQFENLPGQVSLLILKEGQVLAALNPETPLAVGSAFKLAILQALQAQIEAGEHSWDEVIALKPQWKSLPSGILQDWPDGSMLTLETLASLMISQSDNTATDALLEIVGREKVEALSPNNRPFLSTREAFLLKDPNNQSFLETFLSGDTAAKRAVVDSLGKQAIDPDMLWTEPKALEVEWFFTTQELCTFMTHLEDIPLMSINPGIRQTQNWQNVSYKGGSEPGVINMTIGLRHQTGKSYCVSATWNDTKVLDDVAFVGLVEAIIERLP
jgi:beta-lactamase class A